MPIQSASDNQKVDFLWKKIVYGAAKTDISGNIDATNEPNPSPLLIRGDKILQQASLIANVIPGSNSSVVTVYPTTFPIECISTAGIPTPTLTWQTGQTFWVPPEFGSTYQIKVYISPSGQAANVLTKGTQVFATGSGNNDLWVFDYQAGILNFNSNNTPYNASNQPISFTGNSVYISGAVYSGAFGLGNLSYIGANITSSTDITISTTNNANIILNAGGTGIVQIIGDDAVGIPFGNTATRPAYPNVGYIRINTDLDVLEYWNGSAWIYDAPFEITSQSITPNGSSNAYVLTSNTSTAGVMVNINGTIQQPYTAYNIVGNNNIIFTEVPLTTDIIEVRTIATGVVAIQNLAFGDTAVSLDAANVNVTGNILPTANTTYSLGSSSLQWKDLYVSGNSIYMGGTALTISNGVLLVGNATVGSSSSYSNVNVAAYTQTMGFQNYGNVNVAAYVTTNGLTNYSNVNVIAYTQTQSFTNYSNVNVAAYTQTQSYTNYSNVNVAAYVTTNGLTNYSNVNVAAYVTTNGLTNYSNVNVAAYTQTQSYTNYSNVNLSAYLGGAVTIGGNLTIQGNLFVNGNLTTINANNLSISDSMIYLADDNPADTLDIGIVSAFTSAVRYQHTGFVRDATDGVWKLFANVVAEPTTTVDFTNANYSTLQVGNINVLGASGGLINSTGNILANGLSVFGNTRIGSLATPGALHTIIGNVDISGAGTEYVNIGGNLMAVQVSVGSIDSTGFINTSGNVSASIVLAGALTSTGLINTSGNILSTGAIFNSLTVNGNITANVSGFSIGYRDLPQLTIGNVTLALTDAGKHYYSSTGAPQTLTIPSNANVSFTIGTTIVVINKSTANIAISKQSEVSLYTAGNTTNTTRTLTSYGMATLVKTETNVWFLNGVGLE